MVVAGLIGAVITTFVVQDIKANAVRQDRCVEACDGAPLLVKRCGIEHEGAMYAVCLTNGESNVMVVRRVR
jgi:hypothetical protein